MCLTISSSRRSITWCSWRSSAAAVEAAQRERLADVRRGDGLSIGEIGDGACHFQHALASPPRESETFHGKRKHLPPRLIRATPAPHARIGKPGVACPLARELHPACAGHTRGCRGGRLPALAHGRIELACREPRYLHLHVEPVEQRT